MRQPGAFLQNPQGFFRPLEVDQRQVLQGAYRRRRCSTAHVAPTVTRPHQRHRADRQSPDGGGEGVPQRAQPSKERRHLRVEADDFFADAQAFQRPIRIRVDQPEHRPWHHG